MTILESVILAVIEGLTEFLPVSSTGHMIIASSLMGIAKEDFTKTFTVAIQLGAILSVVLLYWKQFLQSTDFYFKLFVAFIPSMICGLLLKSTIDALMENIVVVAASLLIGGIFFLFMDKLFNKNENLVQPEKLSYKKAFVIGTFQVISMIPGVSRSAATIIGGLTQGLNRKRAAEFSFFLAVPTMFGATVKSMYDFYKEGGSFTSSEINLLLIGNLVAFLVAILAIKAFIGFLTRKGFKIFGYYRIILGSIILILYFLDVNLEIV